MPNYLTYLHCEQCYRDKEGFSGYVPFLVIDANGTLDGEIVKYCPYCGAKWPDLTWIDGEKWESQLPPPKGGGL